MIGTAQGAMHLLESFLQQATEDEITYINDLATQGDMPGVYLGMHRITDFNLPTKPVAGIPLTRDEVEGLLMLEPTPHTRRKLEIALVFLG